MVWPIVASSLKAGMMMLISRFPADGLDLPEFWLLVFFRRVGFAGRNEGEEMFVRPMQSGGY